jgi:dihydropteroate synthase
MGILNVTPDSFSDGGQHLDTQAAISGALRMEDAGAAIIDIGGESTRPYSQPVTVVEELRRVIPVIERLADRLAIPISIDTSKAQVAEAALNAGAEIINDITGLAGDPMMLEVAQNSTAGICIMHMQGTPQTMQDAPHYQDVVQEVFAYLQQRTEDCVHAGINRTRICLDPGIGFGKSHQHNLELLRKMRSFHGLNRPLLVGHSRKGFIGKCIGNLETDRMAGTLGVSLAMAAAGVQILRVHDVAQTVQALRLFAICEGFATP